MYAVSKKKNVCVLSSPILCVYSHNILPIFSEKKMVIAVFEQLGCSLRLHLAVTDKKFTLSYRTIIGVQLQCELIPLAIEPFSYARGKNSLGGLPLDGFYLELIYQSKCIEIGWAGVIH